jgi:hypothetical protein
MSVAETWQRKSDIDVETAVTELDQYEPPARAVILAQARLRGLMIPAHAASHDQAVGPGGPGIFSVTYLARVWGGEVGLAQTFWLWGVAVRTVIEATMLLVLGVDRLVSIAFFALVSLGWTVFATVAVFRSARRYRGSAGWRLAAQVVMGFICVRSAIILLGAVGLLLF